MSKLLGTDFEVLLDGTKISKSTSCVLNLFKRKLRTYTKTTAQTSKFDTHFGGSKAWTVTTTINIDYDSVSPNADALTVALLADTEVLIRFRSASNPNYYFEGNARVYNLGASAPLNTTAGISVTFEGTGPLTYGDAVEIFVSQLTTDGIYAKLDSLQVYARPTEVLTDEIAGATPDETDMIFTAGKGHRATSTNGDSINTDISSSYFSNYIQDSACAFGFVHNADENPTGNICPFGLQYTGDEYVYMRYNGGSLFLGLNSTGLDTETVTWDETDSLWAVNRPDASTVGYYINNAYTEISRASTGLPTALRRIHAGGQNVNGARSNGLTVADVAVFGLGSKLTESELDTLNSRCKTLIARQSE